MPLRTCWPPNQYPSSWPVCSSSETNGRKDASISAILREFFSLCNTKIRDATEVNGSADQRFSGSAVQLLGWHQ